MTENEMKNAAETTEMDAASRREHSDERIVQDLEAGKLTSREDVLREKVVGVVCDLCGSHQAITPVEVAVRLTSRHACDCGANHSEVAFYAICETPCSTPSCLCHKKPSIQLGLFE